jgi:hypothetical protein
MATESNTFTKVCTTDFGRFKVKLEPTNLFVGGSNYCVNIMMERNKTTLNWLSTSKGGCELDGKMIRKEETIKMVDLAFSILRRYHPERTIVTLLDDSGYSWTGPRQRVFKVNFLKGYLLMYQKTWYEEKFNAKMENDDIHSMYRKEVEIGFDDPARKPEIFSFGSEKEKLEPLYRDSRTWREFITKIKKQYDNEKYKLMIDWYRQAIYYIMNGMEINQNWKIDISARPEYNCTWSGGSNSSKRKTKKKNFTFSKYYPIGPFYHEKTI